MRGGGKMKYLLHKPQISNYPGGWIGYGFMLVLNMGVIVVNVLIWSGTLMPYSEPGGTFSNIFFGVTISILALFILLLLSNPNFQHKYSTKLPGEIDCPHNEDEETCKKLN